MTTAVNGFFELPEVGEPEWFDNSHDDVLLDGLTYDADCGADEWIEDTSRELARWIAVKQFVGEQAEAGKWDCAGERAYNSYTDANPFDTLWERLPIASRQRWIAAAKAVLDEG